MQVPGDWCHAHPAGPHHSGSRVGAAGPAVHPAGPRPLRSRPLSLPSATGGTLGSTCSALLTVCHRRRSSRRWQLLDETARIEWQRLAAVFADDPVRFREGDRAALVAYAAYWSAFVTAAGEVARDGPVIEGRSDKDRGRLVKNPATVAMREAATQLRFWCRELALTPDSRGRTGITDADPADDAENPFAG